MNGIMQQNPNTALEQKTVQHLKTIRELKLSVEQMRGKMQTLHDVIQSTPDAAWKLYHLDRHTLMFEPDPKYDQWREGQPSTEHAARTAFARWSNCSAKLDRYAGVYEFLTQVRDGSLTFSEDAQRLLDQLERSE